MSHAAAQESTRVRTRLVACAAAWTVVVAPAALAAPRDASAAAALPNGAACEQRPDRPVCATPVATTPVIAEDAVTRPAAEPGPAGAAVVDPAPSQPVVSQPAPAANETEPDPAVAPDECRNLDGVQADVPEGHFIDGIGNCVEPPDMAAGDGIDDTEEHEAGPGASSCTRCEAQVAGGAGPPGGAGGAGGSGTAAATGPGSAGASAPGTAVAGVVAAPHGRSTVGEGASIDAGGDGRLLPFTGSKQVGPVLALGLLLAAVGTALTVVRRRRRACGP